MSKRAKTLVAIAVVLGLCGIALSLLPGAPPPLLPITPQKVPAGPARELATLLLEQETSLRPSPRPDGRAYVALRREGLRLSQAWADGADFRQALLAATTQAAATLSPAQAPDAIEVCLPYARRGLSLRDKRAALGNVHRGVRGMVLRWKTDEEWTCPTEMLATNRSFDKVEERFEAKHRLGRARFVDEVEAEQFDAHQWLIDLPTRRVREMTRGNTVVDMTAVDKAGVAALTEGMAEWLTGQVQQDGRMTYVYWPSRGEAPTHLNNMIRQYMASLALVRLGKVRQDADIEALALRNLRYNFSQFYREEDGVGMITFRGKNKLGAAALAALAIVEAPFRAELLRFEAPLIEMTMRMQQADGSFRTFYGTQRNDNQNFYPGETLLLWSVLLEQQQDDALMERFMRAFRYYRAWHRDNTNPAFIPWHTQAYYKVWKITKDQALADFVFEMNDFLADFQEWKDARYPDTRGRFYDGDRTFYGPPHASATGVYLEGLIDAYEMARALKDEARTARYRTAILRGIRSLMQLQFQDEVDTFYIQKRERVLGALRTTVYDNRIRVDNVQHSLMGLLKIRPAFERDGVLR